MKLLRLHLVLNNLLQFEFLTRRDTNCPISQSTMFLGQEILRFGLSSRDLNLESNEASARDLGYYPLTTMV